MRSRVLIVGGVAAVCLVLWLPTYGAALSPREVAGGASADFGGATGVAWARVATTGAHPSARALAAMAYDSTDHYVVLFGGVAPGCTRALGDTWTFVNGSWSTLSSARHPSARSGASMAWDAADGYLVLFGGTNGSAFFNDTWKFVHGSWSKIHPATSPGTRAGFAMTYDAAARSVVIGGGADQAYGNRSDMWAYHGGAWTQLSVIARHPFHGRFSQMAFDGRDRVVVYFGGVSGFGGNETWEYASGNWTKLAPTVLPPYAVEMSLAFDPALHAVVLLDGGGFSGTANETWGFHGGHWTNLTGGHQPPGRVGAMMAFDAADGYLLVFGGIRPTGLLYADSWAYY